MTGHSLVIRGDARALPLPAASVDLIVTSPPYFALRSYRDGGDHYQGQIGSEATPTEYVEALLECTAEWVRVLKPSGSIFVNLGDAYYSGKGSPGRTTVDAKSPARTARRTRRSPLDYGLDLPRKSLLLLPERYRIGCVDQLGLTARAVVVWSKPNGLPESVTDRVRRSHEDWVHLTRQPRYYSAVDAIREPHQTPDVSDGRRHGGPAFGTDKARTGDGSRHLDGNPLGKLPGSVWEIASEPLRVPDHLPQHFAAFPTEWPRRIILGWSPPGICVECGEGRRPVWSFTGERGRTPGGGGTYRAIREPGASDTNLAAAQMKAREIVGHACACTPYTDHPGTGSTTRRDYSPGNRDNNAQGTYGRHQAGEYERVGPWREYHMPGWSPPLTRPAVVLDPFAGTGTTALAARALGRIGIAVDRSSDYCRLAQWRTTDPGELAKAMRVPKPPPQLDGQESLFDAAEVAHA